MTVHYRTQGFFIKKVEKGEADQLLVFYTKDFGKLEILGRAIRKIKSKLRGGAELFYLSEIEFIQGKTYKILTDAVLINSFQNIRNDLEKLKIAYQISEVLDGLIKGEEPDQEIWSLLIQTFQELNTKYKIQDTRHKIYYYFFWNLVSILGYQPELKNFYITQAEQSEAQRERRDEVSLICGKKINIDIFKILRIIFKKDLKALLRLKFEPFHQKSLKSISQRYLNYIQS